MVFAAAGLAAGWIVRAFLQPVFRLPLLARQNYRGRAVATAGGIVVPFAALLVEAVRDALASIDVGHRIDAVRGLTLFVAVAFGFLGLVDDIMGSGHARGFRGHVRDVAWAR